MGTMKETISSATCWSHLYFSVNTWMRLLERDERERMTESVKMGLLHSPWSEVVDVPQFSSPVEELMREATRESNVSWDRPQQFKNVSNVV